MFQYPLFRIVDCFKVLLAVDHVTSIGFNIRSFGSWIASSVIFSAPSLVVTFQYPLFRIVDCFLDTAQENAFRAGCFNIRSFGSWIASVRCTLAATQK